MAGALLLTAGLGLALWAALTLWRAGTPLGRTQRPRVLVDDGPYRLSRHPMVLGTALALLGLAALTGSIGLVLLDGLFIWAMARWAVPAEEARLAQTFGGWWQDYAASTRRWL